MSNFTEAELVREIPALSRFARSITRNPADAEDLTQNTMERALTRSTQFQPGTNLRAWLFTICRRQHISEQRRAAVRYEKLTDEGELPQAGAPASQEMQVFTRQVGEAARDLLTAKEHDVMRRVCVDGDSYEMTASALSIPVGTVRSRLNRARGRLTDHVDGRREQRPPTLPQAA